MTEITQTEARLQHLMTRLSVQLNHLLNHFPKHEKYALCQEIRSALYGLYSHIVEARKRHHKKTAFTNMDIAHEQLRWLCHLANELGYFSSRHGQKGCADGAKRYIHLSALIDEVGRVLGGWIRSERAG